MLMVPPQGEADKLGVDISGCVVVDSEASERLPAYIDLLCEARKHKVGRVRHDPPLGAISSQPSRVRSE